MSFVLHPKCAVCIAPRNIKRDSLKLSRSQQPATSQVCSDHAVWLKTPAGHLRLRALPKQ
eukprot:15261705-Heterocapsa_arctica.AAC.1